MDGSWTDSHVFPPSHMHRREFDYGLHHDGGYLFFRVGFLSNYFALVLATAAEVLD